MTNGEAKKRESLHYILLYKKAVFEVKTVTVKCKKEKCVIFYKSFCAKLYSWALHQIRQMVTPMTEWVKDKRVHKAPIKGTSILYEAG